MSCVFATNNIVILALISGDVVRFDLAANKITASISTGTSSISDMSISEDGKVVYVGGESGIVSVMDAKDLRIFARYQGGNVDNIYKLDTKNSFVLTAGQDRRAILYNKNGKVARRWDGSFLIYSAALSPSAKSAALTLDEQNNITVVDTGTGTVRAVAKGHFSTLNRIVFFDENSFASCADENKIYIWRTK